MPSPSDPPAPNESRTGAPRARLAGRLAALACAVAAVAIAGRYLSARAELVALRQRVSLAELALKSAQNELAAEHIVSTRLTADYRALVAERPAPRPTGAAQAGATAGRLSVCLLFPTENGPAGAVAAVVWDPASLRGLAAADRLPPAPAGTRYALWVTAPRRVRIGAIAADPEGRGRLDFSVPLPDPAAWALTREPARGAESPKTSDASDRAEPELLRSGDTAR